ncbi:bifunctional glutamate N-acetyltransferase/amino-acid acetyltransferase ArgJ [Thiorhodospira sibirica]|uniref:bifunctional glutamate N-acetyltransferase/amino-acid acetyltransferase ArgJ n=1 Tax=Thiorhodospira sibirica TaxID=154347 RepID=UPI00022C048B|nr:bifunctional glutamate N-acetyltransferase/amino-acid acetyltransferase ArgJ [Thiorhodospira sibirica]
MAVFLSSPQSLLPVAGLRLSAVAANIRYQNRNDVVLMEMAESSRVALVLTQNAFCAAPVVVAREHHAKAAPRYLLINSGNANAGLGDLGLDCAYACCQALAEDAQCLPEQVLPFSTGVIGEPLPVQRIEDALPKALADLQEDSWMAAMQAIMTTDTVPKGISRTLHLHGQDITITGIAKGSGMIAPNMATMLAFIATDARIEQALLQPLLAECTQRSFNCITVDGDTSTNDACVLMATGASGVDIREGSAEAAAFGDALLEICQFLAQAIVRDGEGATKFITVAVKGARDVAEARQVGLTVANSPLVKTALFASDPNWGRILAAVGRAGVADLEVNQVTLDVGDVRVVTHGGRDPRYTEADGQRVMREAEITLQIDLGRGTAQAEVYTCDFSHEYVRINAEYRS